MLQQLTDNTVSQPPSTFILPKKTSLEDVLAGAEPLERLFGSLLKVLRMCRVVCHLMVLNGLSLQAQRLFIMYHLGL